MFINKIAHENTVKKSGYCKLPIAHKTSKNRT